MPHISRQHDIVPIVGRRSLVRVAGRRLWAVAGGHQWLDSKDRPRWHEHPYGDADDPGTGTDPSLDPEPAFKPDLSAFFLILLPSLLMYGGPVAAMINPRSRRAEESA